MFLAMAGAMSTAELGLSLAEMIRQDKVHAHLHHRREPRRRHFQSGRAQPLQARAELPQSERRRRSWRCANGHEPRHRYLHSRRRGHAPHRAPGAEVLAEGRSAKSQRYFPYEYMYQLIRSGSIKEFYEIDPKDSWVIAACEKNLPIFTPGWEDSTLGNIFVANMHSRRSFQFPGREVRRRADGRADRLVPATTRKDESIGFFQIGGGIAGDFPDLRRAADRAGPARGVPAVGLLLPDFRQHHVLRLLQRRRAQRKNHLGQARRATRRDSSSNPTLRSSRR